MRVPKRRKHARTGRNRRERLEFVGQCNGSRNFRRFQLPHPRKPAVYTYDAGIHLCRSTLATQIVFPDQGVQIGALHADLLGRSGDIAAATFESVLQETAF